MTKQLKDLGPGDAVAFGSKQRGGFKVQWIREIERVTKTQIIIGGRRYNRETGDQIPKRRGAFWREHLRPATDRIKHAKMHSDLRHQVLDRIEKSRLRLADFSIAKLTRIRDAFDSEDA